MNEVMEIIMAERELTLAEVAANLRVSEDTARKLVIQGEIVGRKQGRQWRVRESDVEKYKERLRQEREK